MNKLLLLFVVLLLASNTAISQRQKLTAKPNIWGWYNFKLNGNGINKKSAKKIFHNNTRARAFYESSKSNSNLAQLLNGASGLVLGWELGNIIRQGHASGSVVPISIGVGALILSIIPKGAAHRNMEKAIDIINGPEVELSQLPRRDAQRAELIIGRDGIGVRLGL